MSYAENPDKYKAQYKKWQAKNRKKINAQAKKWRVKNRKKINAQRRKRYAENPEKYNAQHKKWRAKNRKKTVSQIVWEKTAVSQIRWRNAKPKKTETHDHIPTISKPKDKLNETNRNIIYVYGNKLDLSKFKNTKN